MWPYSAFGLLTAETVSKRFTLAQPPLGHHGGQADLERATRRDGPVRGVADLVGGGNVEAGEGARERAEEALAPTLGPGREGGAVGGDQLPHQLLALADRDEVHEGRHRLGVRERAHAAHEDQRVPGPARRTARGGMPASRSRRTTLM